MRLEWQEQALRERYADEKNADLAAELGVSERTVLRWAGQLGLRKSEAFLRSVLREANMQVAYLRLCGKKVGGYAKGTNKGGTAGSFGRRVVSEEEEKRRVEAIRKTAWEERKRVLRGEKRKTQWGMVDYGKPKVGGKWQKA